MTGTPSPLSPHRSAAIISVGDEFTLGQKLDTNSQCLSQRLTSLGVRVREHLTVDDDEDAQVHALTRLAARADLIITTGGLGPTLDDLTRAALARASDDTLIEDAEALRDIRAWYASRQRVMPEVNRVQALRPSRAVMLANPFGTAPGLRARVASADVFCLPGPPREMMPMFESFVVSALRADPARTVITRVLQSVGLGESAIAMRFGDLMRRDRNPLVGTTASAGIVSCRVRYEGPPGPDARRAVEDTLARIREVLGPAVFAEGDTTLAAHVIAAAIARRRTIACAESCTGGGLGHALTSVDGSSAAFLGGFLTYSNALKEHLLAVPADLLHAHGAVSAPCALAMAEGALARTGALIAASITGIAGPAGGSDRKPVGTVYVSIAWRDALHNAVHHDTRRFLFTGDRATVRQWAVLSALAMLRRAIEDFPDAPLLGEVPGEDARPAP